MPLNRLLVIIVCGVAAAAATVYLATSLAARDALPAPGLVTLTIVALCAAFGWRVFSDRKAKQDDDQE